MVYSGYVVLNGNTLFVWDQQPNKSTQINFPDSWQVFEGYTLLQFWAFCLDRSKRYPRYTMWYNCEPPSLYHCLSHTSESKGWSGLWGWSVTSMSRANCLCSPLTQLIIFSPIHPLQYCMQTLSVVKPGMSNGELESVSEGLNPTMERSTWGF